MARYTVRRIIQAIPILIFISFISFFIIRLTPGDPVKVFITPQMTHEQIERTRANLGLDKPIYVQYFYWIKNILRGDLGYSFINYQPVSKEISERFLPTIGLMGISLLISIILSILLGIASAIHKDKFIDNLISKICYIGISIPSFWFAMILIYIFSMKLKLLPSIGMRTIGVYSILDLMKHGIMPSIVLSYPNTAILTRYIRARLIDEMKESYVKTAKSKGISQRQIFYSHILRNSLLPMITILGMNLPSLVSGAFITETIFGWPGMGKLGVSSIFNFDYPVIMAITMMSSIMLVLGNLISDICYSLVDPRISL
ncbi:ABC transporter permease [Anaerosalibacter massiliensis]|uniref:ABC transporter permease n=1 Tax=Anaerosalibacter massiliensis TaxID=1347392 RepID=UPI0005B2EA59|nr:ABC transporter permease [Anaerosalibacter massiliensis]